MQSTKTKLRPQGLKNKPIPEELIFDESGRASLTAIEYLLARPQYEQDFDDDYSDDDTNVDRALAATASLLCSKDYSQETIETLIDPGVLNALIQNLLIKGIDESINTGDHIGSVDMMKAFIKLSLDFHGMGYENFKKLGDKFFKPYKGSSKDHKRILSAISKYKKLDPDFEESFIERDTSGYGTARIFQKGILDAMRGILKNIKDKSFLETKIVIIGAGPAGTVTARTLIEIGFNNIEILDQSGKFNGIWRLSSVYKGTINNPFNINFLGIHLPASTGAQGSGEKLINFLDQVVWGKKDSNGKRIKNYFSSKMPEVTKAKILKIKASDLNHQIEYIDSASNTQTITAPIVINAIGLGQPSDLNDKNAPMKTTTPNLCGSRWQVQITDKIANKFNNKDISFIGLGNSSTEMLMQIHELNKQGFNIRYKVLTHYPKASIENPDKYINHEGKDYRVFRDLEKSNLVDLEGDIPAARNAYMKALEDGNIITDLVEWKRCPENKQMILKLRDGSQIKIPTDYQFTLTGYRQSKNLFEKMDISLDESTCPLYDYDGEVQRKATEQNSSRIFKGYSLIGAIRANDSEPNALVIPGIMDSLPKLIFNTILRTIDARN